MGKFSGERVLPEPYDEGAVNTIRGKSLLLDGDAGRDIRFLCRTIDWFVEQLEDCDYEGTFGEDGWREVFGLKEENHDQV